MPQKCEPPNQLVRPLWNTPPGPRSCSPAGTGAAFSPGPAGCGAPHRDGGHPEAGTTLDFPPRTGLKGTFMSGELLLQLVSFTNLAISLILGHLTILLLTSLNPLNQARLCAAGTSCLRGLAGMPCTKLGKPGTGSKPRGVSTFPKATKPPTSHVGAGQQA